MSTRSRLLGALLLLAAPVLFCSPARGAQRAVAVPSVSRDTHVEREGIWLHIRERVDPNAKTTPRTAVLFIHGAVFPGVATFDRERSDSWLQIALAKGLDPYLLDLDGYGESMAPRAREVASLPRAVDDVAAAVAAIAPTHPGGVDLVGYDYGADVAARYAAEYPVTKLVLVAPLLGAGSLDTGNVLTGPMLRNWMGEHVSDAVAKRSIEMAMLDTRGAGRRIPPALSIPAGVFESLERPPLTPESLAALTVPSLLVRGRRDRVFDASAANALVAGAPNLKLLEVDGGHRLPWEPGGLDAARKLVEFLSPKGARVH